MKNWVIKKKQRPDGSSSSDSESKSKTVGGVNSVLAPQDTENVITQGTPAPSLPLQTIEEEHAIDDYGTDELSDDHVDSIEFDLLDNTTCLGLMDINEQVTPYTVLNTPHGVLHVPTLCSPLLSVRCFCCLNGCSFLVNDTGCYLTFPKFFLPVDDTSDGTISGSPSVMTSFDFDSQNVGLTCAFSDNTWFRGHHRPTILGSRQKKPSSPATIGLNSPNLHTPEKESSS